jgi:hypothetical protein
VPYNLGIVDLDYEKAFGAPVVMAPGVHFPHPPRHGPDGGENKVKAVTKFDRQSTWQNNYIVIRTFNSMVSCVESFPFQNKLKYV